MTVGRILALASTLVLAASAAAAQEVRLRLHHFLPTSSTAHARVLQPWAEKVAEQSDGRIAIDIFPAMQLGGKPPQLYDQARTGVADLIWTVVNYTPGRFPTVGVFELPFVPASAEATSRAVQVFYERHLGGAFGDVHPIAFHTHAPGAFHMVDTPVRTMEDLAGLKIRAPTPAILSSLDLLGATPVGMPVPEVPQALSRGVVDGTVLPFEVILPLKVHEMVESHTEIGGPRGLYTAVFVFAMNKARYESLPDDLKAVIDANSGIEQARIMGRAWDVAEAEAREVAVERGNAIHEITGAELARWQAATEPVAKAWVAEADDRGLDGAALLAEARALVADFAE